jgi:hypothetical protein
MPDLPVAECLPRLLAAMGAQPNAVLVAPPGAGKTTCVPLALLNTAPMDQGRILMLEPRRLAARAAAGRMASLIGEPVGRTVGFRTRLESAVSSATRIEVVTTALLVRRLLGDRARELLVTFGKQERGAIEDLGTLPRRERTLVARCRCRGRLGNVRRSTSDAAFSCADAEALSAPWY